MSDIPRSSGLATRMVAHDGDAMWELTGDSRQGAAAAAPIFLVGSERSGSTLLRLMLDHHPQLAFARESEFIVDRVSDQGDWPELREYHDYIRQDRVALHSQVRINPSLPYPELVADFLKQQQGTKELIGATVHRNFHRLPHLWPEARYIYLVRDGRDVAQSVVGFGWAGNVYRAADWWARAHQEWCQLRARLRPDQYVQVRYEDLVKSAAEELRRLCDFLGIAYSDRMLTYPERSTYKLPDQNLAFQWRRRMKPLDVQIVEARVGSLLDHYGYERSQHPELRLSAWDECRLELQSRHLRFRHRVRTYGAALCLAECVTRWTRMKQAHRRFKRAMDAIDEEGVR